MTTFDNDEFNRLSRDLGEPDPDPNPPDWFIAAIFPLLRDAVFGLTKGQALSIRREVQS
jgi:hypothetical protein